MSNNETGFTHLDASGNAHMVDIGEKTYTRREAVAEAYVRMEPATLDSILSASIKKGDVIAVSRIAGIMAAKKTHELIPLCHPILLDSVDVELIPVPPDRILIRATTRCYFKTGVEMEAMTAVSIAALTVYDMCKAIDRGIVIEATRLIKKSGGKSGVYELDDM